MICEYDEADRLSFCDGATGIGAMELDRCQEVTERTPMRLALIRGCPKALPVMVDADVVLPRVIVQDGMDQRYSHGDKQDCQDSDQAAGSRISQFF